MPTDPFLESIAAPLGWYYAVAGGVNAGAAWHAWRCGKRCSPAVWAVVGLGFALAAGAAFYGRPPAMPEPVKAAIDAVLSPVTLTLGTLVGLAGAFGLRKWIAIPAVAWAGLNGSILFMGTSLTDADFAGVVTKPDNLPIVAMVYLLGLCLWWGAAQAVANDERLARGQGPVEKDFAQPVLVWPDLVYIELIAMVVLTSLLVVWSIGVRAPLESPANPSVTPNPSRAPWYFVGLQEMLLYFDPPIAGVILPCLIIFGLAAIPYLDRSPEPSGYYAIRPRRPVYLVFLFGFLQLWILLILIGTFFRGPNWSFFGLYEIRDPHKMPVLQNVKLCELFWGGLLGRGLPAPSVLSGAFVRFATVCWREIAGLAVVSSYFGLLPWALGRSAFRGYRRHMGRLRYWTMMFLLLMMLALPLKMLLRWTIQLSYVVSMPEYFFNF